jgi:CelD/BcsL family acetyltransferase involved in cellulose biosynthesis
MKVTVLAATRLTPAHVEAWSRLQSADPTLASPYFRPEFTRAVAEVRPDVEVAVLEEGGEPAGFFPFQRGRWGAGGPVGGPLSDFHGVVAHPGLAWTAEGLVRGGGLSAWDFNHLLAAQEPFILHHHVTAESPFLDLSGGFEAYRAGRRRAGSELVDQALRKERKLGREVGPVRFEAHTTDPAAFASLLAWKAAQYRRTKAPNVFGFGWTVQLLKRILAASGEEFAGMLSALYAGDRLAAVHLGMRSWGVWHWWFPTYDPDLAKYSPGLVLLVAAARAAPGLGVRRIDLGRGEAGYKNSLGNGAVQVAEGCVATRPIVRLLRGGWRRTREWARRSRLGAPARLAGRWTRSLRGWLAFR